MSGPANPQIQVILDHASPLLPGVLLLRAGAKYSGSVDAGSVANLITATMSLKLEDVEGFLTTWAGAAERPRTVDEFTHLLEEVLQQPILDDRGCQEACLAKVTKVTVRGLNIQPDQPPYAL